mgnify:CR=1 FL=1
MKLDLFTEKSLLSPNLKKYVKKGVLIDTAPLLILFLGYYDKKHKTSYLHKFDSGYTIFDYELLRTFLSGLRPFRLKITPHIFHEFYKHIQNLLDSRLYDFFPEISEYLLKIKEQHILKNDIINHELFEKLEIGEHSLFLTIQEGKYGCILTDERKVCGILEKNHSVLTMNYSNEIKPFLLTQLG